ncbi:MAG: cyanophycin synthetase, partial [Bacillota bacterium]|nr:cyanophycin synthetase [Bacillota bacterium]
KGARRRFEYVGCKNGVTIVDDYAHHPSEIKATLTAAASMGYKKTICIFQPHTYSRTHLLFNDFTKALTGCDTCLLVDIYAAREKNTMGISSNDLALKMGNAVYCGGFENAVEYLRQHAEDGTLVITMGAGDIYKVGQMFLKSK